MPRITDVIYSDCLHILFTYLLWRRIIWAFLQC